MLSSPHLAGLAVTHGHLLPLPPFFGFLSLLHVVHKLLLPLVGAVAPRKAQWWLPALSWQLTVTTPRSWLQPWMLLQGAVLAG